MPTSHPLTLLLRPHDILFFRDSRPMAGASAGHGDRFPFPHVLNSALHAACHRAFPTDSPVAYTHARASASKQRDSQRTERFGSLRTVGPFPVAEDGRWFFPKPGDLLDPRSGPVILPFEASDFPGRSSLPEPLQPLGSHVQAGKSTFPQWMDRAAFTAYLHGQVIESSGLAHNDSFFVTEESLGIGMNPDTGTTNEGQIYSRRQLRFREGCQLGVLTETGNQHQKEEDLLEQLFPEDGWIRVGGEGRVCQVAKASKQPSALLPTGPAIRGNRVKWVLLSPAIFPQLAESDKNRPHPGGWLPTWVDAETMQVQLMDGPGPNKARRLGVEPGSPVSAKLIAARVERYVPVAGWTNPSEGETGTGKEGARSTLLAVPAGTVYYFETASEEEAQRLANALNWHGQPGSGTITNRRSTLLGEKGYGIGVCAPYETL